MKEKFFKVLHLLGVDALLLGLFEKLARELIKRLEAWLCSLHSLLQRAERYRNEILKDETP